MLDPTPTVYSTFRPQLNTSSTTDLTAPDDPDDTLPSATPTISHPIPSLRPHHTRTTHANSVSSLSSYSPAPSTTGSYSFIGLDDPTLQNIPGGRPSSSRRAAHDWSVPLLTSPGSRWFRDLHGRALLMRGVNICGSSKLPTSPNGSTHLMHDQFWDHRQVSFVGRPFPIEEAPEHFGRLRAWGLTLVRLLVPWESLEHAGPGLYDEEYIDYLIALIEMMPKFGIKCFVDPHQDAWSRYSGGSGAPGWTFEVVGLDIRSFKPTGAAYVHQTNATPGDSLPMVWPTNYTKLASATMFTLFFGGDTFAPRCMYQGETVQGFLQKRFIDCYRHLAGRLKHLDAVMGYEVMNEPHPGYIGLPTLNRYDPVVNLLFGDAPTPLQSMALGSGHPQVVDVYTKSWPFPTRCSSRRLMNAEGASAWLPGHTCVWSSHGVWDFDPKTNKPRVLRQDYFAKHPKTGERVDFYRDHYVPFVNRFARAVQGVMPQAYIFVEPLPNEKAPVYTPEDHHHNVVFSPHWYDLNALFYKSFDGRITHDVQSLQGGGNVLAATYFGVAGAKRNYRGQIANIVRSGLRNMGPPDKPCVVGECGIPMDINERRAFETGDYTHHSRFLDAVMSALEGNLINFTLWNYNPANDNHYGDHWNGEDFSIYSPSGAQRSSASLRHRLNRSPGDDETATTSLDARSDIDSVPARKNSGKQKVGAIDIGTAGKNIQRRRGKEGNLHQYHGEGVEASSAALQTPITPFDLNVTHFEDQEVFDPEHALHVGGRVLDAVLRPYAAKVAGEPISSEFNMQTLEYNFTFANAATPRTFISHSHFRTMGSSSGLDPGPSGNQDDPSATDAEDSAADDMLRTEPSITTYGTSLTSNEIAGVSVTDTDLDDQTDDIQDDDEDDDAVSTNRGDTDLDMDQDFDPLPTMSDTDPGSDAQRLRARPRNRRRRRGRARANLNQTADDDASNHTITRSFLLESSSVHVARARLAEEEAAWETEVHVPSYHYAAEALDIRVSDGDWRYVREKQTLYYRHSDVTPGQVHVIRIAVAKGMSKKGRNCRCIIL